MKLSSLATIIFFFAPVAFAQSQLAMHFSDATRFLVAHGRRAWVGGYANAGLEVWAGALQIATDVHAEFRRAGDVTVINGGKIVSKIDVDPSHVSRTYTGPDFSVEEQIWVPLNQPAALFRYSIRSLHPIQVILKFRPSLNLMWPAAIGGQEIRWDAAESGYFLSEPAQQFSAVVLVAAAIEHDEPLNSTRPIPQSDELAIALDPKSPQVLFARTRVQHVGSSAGLDLDAVRGLLQSSAWQQESIQHYDAILSSALQIETPDADVNRALAWAAIALDQDWVCSDELGCAYIAGLGPSRRNRRPQYAWFFAGDGMIALQAALAIGDLEHAREEIRFIARYQDSKTGMIWHELSQSAPYLDWRGKYPYMFVHADLTSPYISTIADYVRTSNDRAFLRELWPSVQKAFEFSQSLIATDGLPRIPAGKQGADEQEPHSDELSLSASWVKACEDYAHLAALMGQLETAYDAQQRAQKARASFIGRYWDAQQDLPIQAYSRTGEPVQDHGLGAIAALNQHLFNRVQTEHVLDAIASWRFQSDWGTRSIPVGEPGFDPTSYAHGSVWAVGTAEVAAAYWAAHRPNVAWDVWRKLVPWSTLDSAGHMHEVLAGDTYQPQLESVPEQSWSSTAFLSTAVRGLFGLNADLEEGTLTVAPHLPAGWDHASINHVQMGNAKLSLAFEQSTDRLSVHIQVDVGPVHLRLEPELPFGARLHSATVCGRRRRVRVEAHEEDEHAVLDLVIPQGSCDVLINYRDGVAIIMPDSHPSFGNVSTGPELTSVALDGNQLHLGLDIVPSRENNIRIRTARPIASATSVKVQKVAEDVYELVIPATENVSTYKHLQASLTFGR